MNTDFRRSAEQIAHRLAAHLNEFGVADPELKTFQSHAYTTEFFAWLTALLYKESHNDDWLDLSEKALQGAITNNNQRRKSTIPLSAKPTFHWEFKNLAFISIQKLIGDAIDPTLAAQLRTSVRQWRTLDIDSANWTAMRLVAFQLRGSRIDRLRARLEEAMLLSMQTQDGFFPDNPMSFSFQYHAYVLALLALALRSEPSDRVRIAFLRGIELIAQFIDPQGDFNYYGRGQHQSFGYAALIFALGEAARIEVSKADHFAELAHRVFDFLSRFQLSDGTFPLLLNNTGDKPLHWGWYDYNLEGDYLAFCGVMLMLADIPTPQQEVTDKPPRFQYFPTLDMTVAQHPDWYAVFASGSRTDSSEAAGLIHLAPEKIAFVGGPKPIKEANTEDGLNYFGPLIQGKSILHYVGNQTIQTDKFHILFDLPDAHVEQTYFLSEGLALHQSIRAKRDNLNVIPLYSTFENLPSDSQSVMLNYGQTHITDVQLIAESSNNTEQIFVSSSLSNPHPFFSSQIKRKFVKLLWVAWVSLSRLNFPGLEASTKS